MDRATFERQKAFAGEKKPSMQRRCVGHDYTERMMYMVTMVVEGRRPLLGMVVGRSDAPAGSDVAARVELTELGERVSKGEKAVMRAAFDEGLPIIVLQENGFTDLAKPGGRRMDACARGQLLLLAPWEHHNERLTIRRDQCLALNDMAKLICEGK